MINQTDKGMSQMTLRTETNPVREYQKRARDKLRLDECLRTEAISYGRVLAEILSNSGASRTVGDLFITTLS